MQRSLMTSDHEMTETEIGRLWRDSRPQTIYRGASEVMARHRQVPAQLSTAGHLSHHPREGLRVSFPDRPPLITPRPVAVSGAPPASPEPSRGPGKERP